MLVGLLVITSYSIHYTKLYESTRCLQCTCEAIGYCDLRRLGIEYGTTLRTLEPQHHEGAGYRSVSENVITSYSIHYTKLYEAPRGLSGAYAISDGTDQPFRLKIPDPSFVTLQVMGALIPGNLLADIMAIFATLDPIMGGIDK